MNSATHAVCENLKVFGLLGFAEKTEAYRFKRDKALNYHDRDRVYWQETGRHLPRPDRARRGTRKQKQTRSNQFKLTKSKLATLLADL